MNEKRGSMYLVTGFILGLAFGLVYSWVVSPVEYVNAAPNSLREDFKRQYLTLVSVAYMTSGDLERAKARLNELGEADIAQVVAIEAQRALAEGRPSSEAQALASLAAALGQAPASVVSPMVTMTSPLIELTATQSPTPVLKDQAEQPSPPPELTIQPTMIDQTPQPTNTLLPTRTASPTEGAAFELMDMSLICDPEIAEALLQVETRDAAGEPVPGVEFIVNWDGGEDHFFTGLKPELGLGYADFSMTPGITYVLRLAEGGDPIPDLMAAECELSGGERYWGSWRLIFAQP
jgi:hypothetical protein